MSQSGNSLSFLSDGLEPGSLAANIIAAVLYASSYALLQRIVKAFRWWPWLTGVLAFSLCLGFLYLLQLGYYLWIAVVYALLIIAYFLAGMSPAVKEESEYREFFILHSASENAIRLLKHETFTTEGQAPASEIVTAQDLDGLQRLGPKNLISRLNSLCEILRSSLVDGYIEGHAISRRYDGGHINVAIYLPTEHKGFSLEDIKRFKNSSQTKKDIMKALQDGSSYTFLKLFATTDKDSLSLLHQGLLPIETSLAGECFQKKIPIVKGTWRFRRPQGRWERRRFFDIAAIEGLSGGDRGTPLDLGHYGQRFPSYSTRVVLTFPIFSNCEITTAIGVLCIYYTAKESLIISNRTIMLMAELTSPVRKAVYFELVANLTQTRESS